MAAMTSSPRPKMRPEPMMGGNDAEARNGNGGGKGGEAKSQKQIQSSMTDKRWGYYDPYTAKKVPWFIDMINGGGMNAAGDTFQGGFGTAALAGGVMNQLGIKPYGADRERAYMPMEAWRGGDYTIGAQPAAPTPAGGGSQPAGLLRPRLRPRSVSETAAMEDAYPVPAYMYDYPTYAPKPTTTAPASVSDPYSYLFQGQGRPAQVEKYTPTGGTTAATGMTYGGVSSGNLEDQMRQKMRSAGYDPTGLGPMELQTFIQAMGL